MAERVRYDVFCEALTGVRTVLELRATTVQERRLRGPLVLDSSLMLRRVFDPPHYAEADRLHHELDKAAKALNDGTYGWDVLVDRIGNRVRVRMMSRLFDGERLVVAVEAEHEFDAADESVVESSAAFRAELDQLAAERNDAAWQAISDAGAEEAERWRTAEEAQRDAAELEGILRGLDGA